MDRLILQEFEAVLGRALPMVIERWPGTYASAPGRDLVVDAPMTDVRLATVTIGAGAAVGALPGAADVAALMDDLSPLMTQAAAASRLIPGAASAAAALRGAGLKIGSSTGYTRAMMALVLARAAEQGYVPDHVVCADEMLVGRPSPVMIYKACTELAVWPLDRVVKVDDAGVAEGRAAGCFTVSVCAYSKGSDAASDYGRAADPPKMRSRPTQTG